MTIWYVDAENGADGAAGTEGAPLKSVGAAYAKAANGDEIVVGDGVYREALTVAKKLTIRAANSGQAIFDGGYGPKLRGQGQGFDGKATAAGGMPSPTAANQTAFGFKLTGPLNSWAALVKVTAAGVALNGLVIRNSAGRGLQIMGSGTTVHNCHVDFCYNGYLWIGAASAGNKINGVVIEDSRFTRGSMRAFDWSRGFGGTPMGVDGCLVIQNATGTTFTDSAFAYGLGEGATPYRGASNTTFIRCRSIGHLHDNWYINAGGEGLALIGCEGFDPINAMPQLEESKLGVYGNVTFGDEEKNWISGPGVTLLDCIFGPSWAGTTFTIEGWDGKNPDNFPRPFVMRKFYMGHCVIAPGARNTRAALFNSSANHIDHSDSLIENSVFTGDVTAVARGKGFQGVVFRNLLSTSALPAALGAISSQVATQPIMVAPGKEINATGFNLWAEEPPDPYATTFDKRDYLLVEDSPARGMAANGAANGITPPVSRPDVGPLVSVDEPDEPPPPDPEPEPEPEPPSPDPDPEPPPPDPEPEPEPEPPPPDPEPEPEPEPDWREGLDPRDRDLLVSAAAYAIGPRGGFPGEGLILLVDKLAKLLDEE